MCKNRLLALLGAITLMVSFLCGCSNGKKNLSGEEIFEKLIKIIPRVGPKEDAKSIIVVKATRAAKDPSNTEFRNVKIQIEIFVPLTQWFIKDTNLRPYLIMGEIEKSLNGKTVNGIGRMSGGDFDTNFFTEEIGVFEQTFWITSYE